MPSLWFVTPVHGRVNLTRICLEQRARVLHELSDRGVDAHQVIVGNDENLDTARELGFHVLERPNLLGLRINDGMEYACREGGADFVAYAGSDDWFLPDFLADLPSWGKARSSRFMTFVSPDGRHFATMPASGYAGHPPWTISRPLLEASGFRPAKDEAMSGLDSYISYGLQMPREEAFEYHADDDELRAVDFKNEATQITPWRWVVSARHVRDNPFEALATRYPSDLCERMEEHYSA